jgi:hypothetical protein
MERTGDKVSWHGVSRIHTGIITGQHKLGYIVQLDNDKSVIVAEDSIISP